jgi:hypothetical protein
MDSNSGLIKLRKKGKPLPCRRQTALDIDDEPSSKGQIRIHEVDSIESQFAHVRYFYYLTIFDNHQHKIKLLINSQDKNYKRLQKAGIISERMPLNNENKDRLKGTWIVGNYEYIAYPFEHYFNFAAQGRVLTDQKPMCPERINKKGFIY